MPIRVTMPGKKKSGIQKIIRYATPKNIASVITYAYSYNTNTGACPVRYALVEVSNRCNLRCIMCQAKRTNSKDAYMNYELFKKIIDELCDSGLKIITIGSIAEPTMNKDIEEMLKYIQQKKIITELITNLSLPLGDDLIATIRKLDKVTISIDGATKETYEKIRVGASFEKTISNLRKISSSKKEDQIITINYVIQKENYREVPKMIYLLNSIGNINKLSTGFAHIHDVSLKPKIHLDKKELTEFKNRIIPLCEKASFRKQLITNHIISSEYWEKNDIRSAQESNKEIFNRINAMPCYSLWTSTFVCPDGTVYPCCTFWSEKEYVLGSLKKECFKDIWDGEKYNNLRKKFKKNKAPQCRYCTALSINEKIDRIVRLKLVSSRYK